MKPNNVSEQGTSLNGRIPLQERNKGKSFLNKVRVYAERHPRRTIAGMLLFALLNFGLMLYISNREPKKPFLPSILEGGKKTIPLQQGTEDAGGPAFSLGNYMQVARLKDSLDMLMAKKTLTHADTLMALRIFEAYSRLDPSFLPQVTNALKGKQKSSNP